MRALLFFETSVGESLLRIILFLQESRRKVFRREPVFRVKYTIRHIGVELMSLVDVVLDRRSIRRYEQKEIPKDILDKILEAGRQAPSAANKQPWHFIVLTDYEIKKELSKGLFNRFIKDAPVTIVGCAHKDLIAGKWSMVSTTIALQNMVVAAWAMGVGSCWIGDFNEERVKRLLSIPENWNVVALVSFGYPSEKPQPRKKKAVEEIVGFNKF
jgi:nitroreductase